VTTFSTTFVDLEGGRFHVSAELSHPDQWHDFVGVVLTDDRYALATSDVGDRP
jgi:hypothetical protein